MFGGPRDSEWTHIRVVGDRAEAAKYLPFARVLLGAAKAAVKTGVIKLNVLSRRLNNGVTIRAEMAMGVPRIVITIPPKPREQDDDVKLDGFVVWPINQANPTGPFADGQPSTYPQYVLSPPVGRQQAWWTFAYDRFLNFWQAITGRKNIYKEKQNGQPVLPDGLRFYGNRYWHGSNGVALSWHGGLSGAHSLGEVRSVRSPGGLMYTEAGNYMFKYSTLVYHFGDVMLDISTYPGYEPGTYVAAASVSEPLTGERWLYVLEFTVADAFRSINTKYALVRYPLKPGPQRAGYLKAEVDTLRAPNREVLWTRGWETSVDPSPAGRFRAARMQHAEFSPNGRKLVLHTAASYVWYDRGASGWIAYNHTGFDRVFEIDVWSGTAQSTTEERFGPGEGRDTAPFCYGYSRDNVLRSIAISQPTTPGGSVDLVAGNELSAYVIGATRVPACVWGSPVVRRELVHADPGGGRLLLQRVDATLLDSGAFANPFVLTLELWSESGLVKSWPSVTTTKSGLGYTLYNSFLFYVGNIVVGRNAPDEVDTSGDAAVPLSSFAPSAAFETIVSATAFSIGLPIGLHAHQNYVPFEDDGAGQLRYSDNVVLTGGVVTFYGPSDGGFHGRSIYSLGFPPVVSYVRFENYTLLSCYRPGAPDDTIVDILPDGDAAKLTGFALPQFRLHPATVLGSPIFKTE